MKGSKSIHGVLQRGADTDAGAAVKLRNEKKEEGKMRGDRKPHKWQLPNKGQIQQPHT
jgi:hypothetical protein